MEKRLPGLDLDALRSFVTGMECGSFAQAALRLSRSTSAVSAQLKKLESQCGAALVSKQGRHLVLTAEGEKLMSYARRLLALNDETLRTLQGERLTGEIHLGMQEDFGESLMPGILGQFKRQVVFVSHSLSGIWAAVQAGLGLTIRTRIGMPGNLRPAGGLLPAPGSLAVSLRQTPREEHHSAAVALLGELMTEALQGWLDR